VRSSAFSLRAVCVGNGSITLSKAELHAGVTGACSTVLHNRGPVSCIWSAVPQLPSPRRAGHSCQAPSSSFQAAASGTEGQAAAPLLSQSACVRVRADTPAPCPACSLWSPITSSHVPLLRATLVPLPAVLPPSPGDLMQGLSTATFEVAWCCGTVLLCLHNAFLCFQSLTATPNQAPLRSIKPRSLLHYKGRKTINMHFSVLKYHQNCHFD